MPSDHHSRVPSQPEFQDPLGCIPRIFWMMMGPLGLFLALVSVGLSAGWSVADLAYWVLVVLLIVARYVDVVRFKGQTADGEPATSAHLRRYILSVLALGVALWVAARALGPGFK